MRTVLAITLGVLLSFSAQASSLVGSITGRAVNAAGGGVANQRMDLVRGGQVVNVVTTDSQGAWRFANVAAGEYTVRTSVNGKLAGVRVMVAEGATVKATTIVVPTASVAPQFGALAGLVGSAIANSTAVVAAISTAGLAETDLTSLDADEVVAIFNALPAAEQATFAAAVVSSAQVTTSGGGGGGNVFQPAPLPSGSSAGAESNAKAGAVFQVLQQVSQVATNNPGAKVTIAAPVVTATSGGTVTAQVSATAAVNNVPLVVPALANPIVATAAS